MLFVTTRNNTDVKTAHHALCTGRDIDGGLFIPFRNPGLSGEEIISLESLNFSGTVALLLNRMFGTRLTSWDVDLAAGRQAVRLHKLHHRILIGECWHNPQWKFSRLISDLAAQVGSSASADGGSWIHIGVRIAVLFGIYGELKRFSMAGPGEPFDISSVSGDFSWPISAWYARSWGLPIGNIVCCCNENSDIWNLFSHGVLRTDGVAVSTKTPDADILIPENLERLIAEVGDSAEVARYLECVRKGMTYYAPEILLTQLRKGMYVTVTSQNRMLSTIPNVYATVGYLLSPYDALSYAGLMDYRSRTGESRYALILSDSAPQCTLETVSEALNISEQQLKTHFDKG